MYAIIKTGGKQYRVTKDQVIDVELLPQAIGDEVEFKEILFFHNGSEAQLGSPLLKKGSVKAEVLDLVRGPKVESVKYKRRKNQRTHWGHRQDYTRIKIKELSI
jgi:large subunit ribosomal protein L21